MFAMIDVNDVDIAYAEKILLKEGQSFDEERRNFIKDLTTLDLQAVPGSGKTTALLAKLLILEKYMPFNGGAGILVVSHTNAAVDEIHSRIGKYAPKLFRYPNYIGTIQSFVDNFLAIPFYVNQFKYKPYRIDNEIYDEQVEKFYINTNNYSLKGFLNKQLDGLAFLKSVRFCKGGRLKSYINGNPDDFKLKNRESITYKGLQTFKIQLLKNGYLHFDDAYSLAEFQIEKVPNYIKLLQARFNFVFVDEMQDMDIHQHNLLESIFFENGSSSSNFQRIGDINQAIYNGNSIHISEIWSHRTNTLQIRGSHRINNRLAPIIERLGLTSYEIEGRNRNDDGTEIDIKPQILIFNDDTIGNVIPQFATIIAQLQTENKIPSPCNHKFMAVAWRKEHEDVDKLGLSDYWNDYSVSTTKTKIDFKVLKDYLLFYDRKKDTLEVVRKQILNAFLKILRLENILDDNNSVYSKRKLLNYLQESHFDEYENLKLLIYQWSISCINEKIEDVYLSIKHYIPTFLALFAKPIVSSRAFIEGESDITIELIESIETSNFYKHDNIKIEVGTIHSAKGQTHTATLYLETFYERGFGNYESERLRNQFLGESVQDTLKNIGGGKDKVKQSAKMAYVGFSRPTHLLCFAIHKSRFDSILVTIDKDIWDITELPIQ